MDNVTQSLVGWTLGQAGLKRTSRKGLAVLILGANMPDIDVFFGHSCWAPLATHRGFTHGLVGGVLLMPPLLAGLLWLLDRWQVRRGATFKSGLEMRFGVLVGLAYLATLTHPLLDLLTTYSVQLFSPVSNAWWHADALFIIDIGLWVVLPSAILLSKKREGAGRADWEWPARVGLTVGLVYIAFNLGLSERAKADLQLVADSPRGPGIFASPPPFAFWRRELVWRHGEGYARASWDPLAGGLSPPPYQWRADGLDDPLVHAAIVGDRRLRAFLRWSVMPVAEVERRGCSARVALGDARYGGIAKRAPLQRVTEVPIAGCGRALAKP